QRKQNGRAARKRGDTVSLPGAREGDDPSIVIGGDLGVNGPECNDRSPAPPPAPSRLAADHLDQRLAVADGGGALRAVRLSPRADGPGLGRLTVLDLSGNPALRDAGPGPLARVLGPCEGRCRVRL